MKPKKNIAILLLAAGQSSRMGRHIKQLLAYKKTNLLSNALVVAKASSCDAIYLVLGANEEIIKAETDLSSFTIIHNQDWQRGLGSSIAAGLSSFDSKSLKHDAVLIMLADQPLIDSEYLNRIMYLWDAHTEKIITTQYKNRSGVPAIFGKEHFGTLSKLDKDFGAKDLIASNKDKVMSVDPQGKAIDIDTWDAYQKLLNNNFK